MPSGVTFDALDHHRERTRRAEARADTLKQINTRLYRLLTLALRVAVNNTRAHPCDLLNVLEEYDRQLHQADISDGRMTELLRLAA